MREPQAPRSVYEAFGHHDNCNVWVETPESYHLDRSRGCTCDGDDMSSENEPKLRTASESVGWLNSVGPLSTSPTSKPDPSVPLSAIRALVQQWREDALSVHHPEWNEAIDRCADQLAALCPAPPEDQG